MYEMEDNKSESTGNGSCEVLPRRVKKEESSVMDISTKSSYPGRAKEMKTAANNTGVRITSDASKSEVKFEGKTAALLSQQADLAEVKDSEPQQDGHNTTTAEDVKVRGQASPNTHTCDDPECKQYWFTQKDRVNEAICAIQRYLKDAGDADRKESRKQVLHIISKLPQRVDRWILYGKYYERLLQSRAQAVKPFEEEHFVPIDHHESANVDQPPLITASSKTKDGYTVELDKTVCEIILQPGQTIKLAKTQQDKHNRMSVQVVTLPSRIEDRFTHPKAPVSTPMLPFRRPQFAQLDPTSAYTQRVGVIKAQMGVSFTKQRQDPDISQVQPPITGQSRAARPIFITEAQRVQAIRERVKNGLKRRESEVERGENQFMQHARHARDLQMRSLEASLKE